MLWALGPTALLVYSTLVLVLHFTCTVHLCLLYKALMYIISLGNTIQSLSISNMVSEPLLWPFLSSFVFISVTLFFSTSLPPSQPPPQPFAVVKEFHTAQTTAARITATNIAPIMVLKLPQRSSCVDLQNRESLNTVGDCTRPHTPLKVSIWLITRSTCRHAPPRIVTRLHAPVSPTDVSPSDVICHVIVDQDVDLTVDQCWLWPLTLTEGWLWPLTFCWS